MALNRLKSPTLCKYPAHLCFPLFYPHDSRPHNTRLLHPNCRKHLPQFLACTNHLNLSMAPSHSLVSTRHRYDLAYMYHVPHRHQGSHPYFSLHLDRKHHLPSSQNNTYQIPESASAHINHRLASLMGTDLKRHWHYHKHHSQEALYCIRHH